MLCMPHSSVISNKPGSGRSIARGNSPSCLASVMTVTPEKPWAPIMAVSGLFATATLVWNPSFRSDCRILVAICCGDPNNPRSPSISRITMSTALSWTRGENFDAQSRSAECAEFSIASDLANSFTPKLSACCLVKPTSTPMAAAFVLTATTLCCGGIPSRMPTGCSRIFRFARRNICTGKFGTAYNMARLLRI